MTDIAVKEGDRLPDIATLGFRDELETSNPQDRFVIRMAETSVSEVIAGLWKSISLRRPTG